jgi:hypothetical protein
MNNTIETIAKEHLQLETLETRYADRLDFHDLAVWRIREALQAAHDAGAGTKTAAAAIDHGLSEDQLSISVLDSALIKAAANGLVDLNELARNHMKNCGLDLDGKWVGFAAGA